MPDLRITELQTLAGADLAAGDYLPLADVSASESKKITVTDFVGNAVTLIADATIPSGKVLFNNNTVPGAAIQDSGITSAKLLDDSVNAAKLADYSTVDFVTALPASGAFRGQLAVDTTTLAVYCWNGTVWQAIKAAGSVNTVVGGSAGIVNITVTQSGDTVTVNTTLDDTTDAAQFLAGPSGSAGSVSYRLIAAADLPTATTGAKGAVRVSGSGLTMSGDQLQINNTVTANTSTYHLVRYDANGLVTGGRTIVSGDLPAATAGALGAVYPGTGLTVSVDGQINHSNAAATGTYTKVTVDAQGHITAGSNLQASDIPNISAAQVTSGELPGDRIANDAVTGAKLADLSVTQFGGALSTTGIVVFPTAEFTGQYFFDTVNGDLYVWDGNTWQPITLTTGVLIYAGTFNASLGGGTGQIASLTAAGTALGLTVGGTLPAASASNNKYYFVVSVGGTISAGNAPAGTLAPPDMVLSNGVSWQRVAVSSTLTGVIQASAVTFTPGGTVSSSNVQAAITELDTEKLAVAGGTVTGELLIGTTGALAFEGATNNAFETYLTVADPTTADRTITLPDRSGTVITDGDTGTVTNTMLAGSIALSKLAPLTNGNIIVGSAGNVATSVPVSGDITITNTGAVDIVAGSIINADIAANAAIAFSKLAPLNSGSLLVGNASNVATAVAMTGDVTVSNTGVATVIAGSTSVAGKLQLTNSVVSTSTTTAATANSVKAVNDVASAALSRTGGTMTGAITFASGQKYPQVPQNAKTAAYVLVASDAGMHISITTGGVTVNSGVFSIGDIVTIFNNSSANQSIIQGTSVTLRLAGTATTGTRVLAQYGVATLLCVASNVFVVSGVGLT